MNKLDDALHLLKLSLEESKKDPENKVIIAGVIKSFEISFEYVWKAFKKIGNEAGNEVYSPRDAIKAASEIGMIEDFDVWTQFLNARNLSVHDYLGVTDKEILEISKKFLEEAKKITWK